MTTRLKTLIGDRAMWRGDADRYEDTPSGSVPHVATWIIRDLCADADLAEEQEAELSRLKSRLAEAEAERDAIKGADAIWQRKAITQEERAEKAERAVEEARGIIEEAGRFIRGAIVAERTPFQEKVLAFLAAHPERRK